APWAPTRLVEVEVEQLVEEGLALAVTPAIAVVPLVPVTVVTGALVGVRPIIVALSRRFALRHHRRRPLDDLVELAAIEPNAAAFRAIVDLDALPVRYQQLRLVYRALHGRLPRKLGRLEVLYRPVPDAVRSTTTTSATCAGRRDQDAGHRRSADGSVALSREIGKEASCRGVEAPSRRNAHARRGYSPPERPRCSRLPSALRCRPPRTTRRSRSTSSTAASRSRCTSRHAAKDRKACAPSARSCLTAS